MVMLVLKGMVVDNWHGEWRPRGLLCACVCAWRPGGFEAWRPEGLACACVCVHLHVCVHVHGGMEALRH